MEVFRGDTFRLDFAANLEGKPYTFKIGDVLKVGIKEKISNPKCGLYKKITIDEETDSIKIYFSHEEMKKVCEGDKILEIELTDTSGDVTTVYQEKIKVKGDVINE